MSVKWIIVENDNKLVYQQCIEVNLHRAREGSMVDERILFQEIPNKLGTIMTSVALRCQIEPNVIYGSRKFC